MIKLLYPIFPQQSIKEPSDVLKREHEAVEKQHICFKGFIEPDNKKVRDHCHYMGLYQSACNPQQLQPQVLNTRPHSHCVSHYTWLLHSSVDHPPGKAGKLCIDETSKLLKNPPLKRIAMKTITIIPSLFLQKPSKESKLRYYLKALEL